jgi:hypothetical protein
LTPSSRHQSSHPSLRGTLSCIMINSTLKAEEPYILSA